MRLTHLLPLAVIGRLSRVASGQYYGAPTVTISNGAVVVGTAQSFPTATNVDKFLGIPFAKSPPERFAPPEDPERWSQPLVAQKYKPACIQQFNYPESVRDLSMKFFNNPGGSPPVESEDCLYVNVYRPATAPPKEGRAVLFWIYGGSLQSGSASFDWYDGTSFAAHQDVLVVAANYRTNAFGFADAPELPADQRNTGFLDQRKALQWVQQNIRAFGGDPAKVTIFGQSSGGYSVKQLLELPPSPRPFRAAIMQSQASSTSGSTPASWRSLVELVNCSGAASQLACVRKVPATTIKSVIEHNGTIFPSVYDNVTSLQDARGPISAGQFAKVPVLIGTNANEWRVFLDLFGIGSAANESAVQPLLESYFPGQPGLQKQILAAYPKYLTPFERIGQILTDADFTCPSAALANLAVDHGHTFWRYYFNASFPNMQLFPDAGAFHSAEIPEAFGTYSRENAAKQQISLSRYMQKAWADFAKDPSQGPGWQPVGSHNGIYLGDLGGNQNPREKTIPVQDVDHVCSLYKSRTDSRPL